MITTNVTSQQFAHFFQSESLKPFAEQVFRKLGEGHICIDLEDQYPGTVISALGREKFVSTDPGIKQPFILHNNRLYLQRYFSYETTILQRIRDFVREEDTLFASRVNHLEENKIFLNRLFIRSNDSEPVSDADWQMVSAIHGVLNNFTIITGGPGTGKTTTVARILALLLNIEPELKIALAAPTGKAATRMAESLQNAQLDVEPHILEKFRNLEPSTIHRLLKMKPGTPYFRHNRKNPLSANVVIIDEGSMIDVALFAKLLDAIGPGTRLIILGDKDQLASVEAGSMFGDLCESMPELNKFSAQRMQLVNSLITDSTAHIHGSDITENISHPLFQHIIELRFSRRFSDTEGIGKFSKAIIQNDHGSIAKFLNSSVSSQVVIDDKYDQQLFESFIDGYRAYINEPDTSLALEALNNLRVLCAIREGEQGLYLINKKIEKYLAQKKLLNLSGEFYENRPIIITRNFYNLGLFNGDTGIIRVDEKGVLRAWFNDGNGRLKSVLPGYLSSVETVFAMTIHKSQGSEFNEVLVILPATANVPILTRELLYTAVTRARNRIFLQGTSQGIMEAAGKKVQRGSGINDRFLED